MQQTVTALPVRQKALRAKDSHQFEGKLLPAPPRARRADLRS